MHLQELQESNLKQLDEFYKLISPTREGEASHESQLSSASEHIQNYLDAKDKAVAGTTYKDVSSIVERINVSSYFDGGVKKVVEEVTEVIEDETPLTAEGSETSAPPAAADVVESEEEEVQVTAQKEVVSNNSCSIYICVKHSCSSLA